MSFSLALFPCAALAPMSSIFLNRDPPPPSSLLPPVDDAYGDDGADAYGDSSAYPGAVA